MNNYYEQTESNYRQWGRLFNADFDYFLDILGEVFLSRALVENDFEEYDKIAQGYIDRHKNYLTKMLSGYVVNPNDIEKHDLYGATFFLDNKGDVINPYETQPNGYPKGVTNQDDYFDEAKLYFNSEICSLLALDWTYADFQTYDFPLSRRYKNNENFVKFWKRFPIRQRSFDVSKVKA